MTGCYRLNINGYTGNAGGDSLQDQNGEEFTTIDRDNDRKLIGNCALERGGGFWYRGGVIFFDCALFQANSRYSRQSAVPEDGGISWLHWHGDIYSLKAVSMAFRAIS